MAAGSRFYSKQLVSGEEVGVIGMRIKLDFTPSFIFVNNVTTNSLYFWQKQHGDAGHTSIITSGANTTDIATAVANGITVTADDFLLGTGVQTTADVIYWVAFR